MSDLIKPARMRGTPKCPRCDGPDSAIRWKDVKNEILICLSCGSEWKRNSSKVANKSRDMDKDDCYLKAYRAGWNDSLEELERTIKEKKRK